MLECKKILNQTDVKYRIITAGSKFDIGFNKTVFISVNGKIYPAKMHSKAKGRIDGLALVYNECGFAEGDVLEMIYDGDTNTITIHHVGAEKTKSGNITENEINTFRESFDKKEYVDVITADNLDSGAVEDLFTDDSELTEFSAPRYGYTEPFLCEIEGSSMSFVYNNNWVCIADGSGRLLLQDETTEDNKYIFDIPDNISDATPIALNNRGIWFVSYDEGKNDGYVSGIHRYVIEEGQLTKGDFYRCNGKKRKLEQFCSFGDAFFAVSNGASTKTQNGVPCIIEFPGDCEKYIAQKGEKITNFHVIQTDKYTKNGISENDYLLVFRLKCTSKERCGWHVFLHSTMQEILFLPDGLNVYRLFFDQGVAWIKQVQNGVTQLKCVTIDALLRDSPQTLAVDSWIINYTFSDNEIFFDGGWLFRAFRGGPSRIDKSGTEYRLSRGLHWAYDINQYQITNHYVYLKYDGIAAYRVPRDFSSNEENQCIISEAVKIEGLFD